MGYWITFFNRYLPLVPRYIKYGLLFMTVLGIVLFEGNVIEPEDLLQEGAARKFAIFYLILLVGSVISIVYETRRSVEELSNRVRRLVEPHEKLYDLKHCTEDLAQRLSRLQPNQKVVMKHIGLNLEQSWTYFEKEFFRVMTRKDVELYILALTSVPGEVTANRNNPAPANVQRWCGNTALMVNKIENYLNVHKPRMIQDGLRVKAEIKQYGMLPLIHGFSVSGAFNAHYISICRWIPDSGLPKDWEYDWGENCYRKLTSETQLTEIKDLAAVFDGYFEYLWNTSGDPVFPTFNSQTN